MKIKVLQIAKQTKINEQRKQTNKKKPNQTKTDVSKHEQIE